MQNTRELPSSADNQLGFCTVRLQIKSNLISGEEQITVLSSPIAAIPQRLPPPPPPLSPHPPAPTSSSLLVYRLERKATDSSINCFFVCVPCAIIRCLNVEIVS